MFLVLHLGWAWVCGSHGGLNLGVVGKVYIV